MHEYVTEAVVLNHEPKGDLDTRFVIFTRKYGKLHARAKSARKITSKLSGHLQPGNHVVVRLIEKKGLQVVDALKRGTVEVPLSRLYLLDKVLPEAEADSALWRSLTGNDFSWNHVLSVLGWDPRDAQCAVCGDLAPAAFGIETQEFFCPRDASRLRRNQVILLQEA